MVTPKVASKASTCSVILATVNVQVSYSPKGLNAAADDCLLLESDRSSEIGGAKLDPADTPVAADTSDEEHKHGVHHGDIFQTKRNICLEHETLVDSGLVFHVEARAHAAAVVEAVVHIESGESAHESAHIVEVWTAAEVDEVGLIRAIGHFVNKKVVGHRFATI